MKLDAMNGVLLMLHSHYYAVLGLSRDAEYLRQRIPFNYERVIPGRREPLCNAGKDVATIVLNQTGLAMHQSRSMNDPTTEDLADRLVPKADAKNGYGTSKAVDHLHADTGVSRPSWTGGYEYPGRIEVADLCQRNRIVSKYRNLVHPLRNDMHQVIGERVVIVDDENHEVQKVVVEVEDTIRGFEESRSDRALFP